MISRSDKIAAVLVLLFAVGFFFYMRQRGATAGTKAPPEEVADAKGKKKSKKKNQKENGASPDITISQKWQMPEELTEISGLAPMPDGRLACVQDEVGKIFVFNTATGKVEQSISFAGPGDYEGIAVAGNTAYVLRADGRLYEVANFLGGKPSVREHATHLTAKHDVEGLCYDAQHDRLLLAVKGQDPTSDTYKGIYAFDLKQKKLASQPAYKVMHDAAEEGGKGKKGKVQPSGIIRHPSTNELYIVDGPSSRLIVLDTESAKQRSYQLDEEECPQPEGIAFTPAGDLYISNEGRNGIGNILKIALADPVN